MLLLLNSAETLFFFKGSFRNKTKNGCSSIWSLSWDRFPRLWADGSASAPPLWVQMAVCIPAWSHCGVWSSAPLLCWDLGRSHQLRMMSPLDAPVTIFGALHILITLLKINLKWSPCCHRCCVPHSWSSLMIFQGEGFKTNKRCIIRDPKVDRM